MAIAVKLSEATFNLIGEDKAECIEVVEVFNYLGRLLDRYNKKWPEVLWNISMSWHVWGHIEKKL